MPAAAGPMAESILDQTLIIGYGNVDRQDDGVAWHVLDALGKRLGRRSAAPMEEDFESEDRSPELLFVLQLTPELAEKIAQFERVCFVDAHTGNISEEIQAASLSSEFQSSPFTHHMTPQTCLALSKALYGKTPRAMLVTIRGYEFGFSRSLSARTQGLLVEAVELIWDWLGPRDSQSLPSQSSLIKDNNRYPMTIDTGRPG